MKHLSVLVLLATTCALSTSPAWAWWQFVANGPNSAREVSPRFRTEKECQSALKATETFMAKKFPDRYPIVGSCEEYRDPASPRGPHRQLSVRSKGTSSPPVP
jgi:hypothetical protein